MKFEIQKLQRIVDDIPQEAFFEICVTKKPDGLPSCFLTHLSYQHTETEDLFIDLNGYFE